MKVTIVIILFLFSSLLVNGQSYITTQDVNIRIEGRQNSGLLGVIPKGTNVKLTETSNNWGKITFQGIEGYISTKFLLIKVPDNFDVPNPQPQKSESSNILNWIFWITLISALFIFRNNPIVAFLLKSLTAIFRVLFPEAHEQISGKSGITSRVQKREVYCSKCGEIQRSGVVGNSPNCSNGGRHVWRA